MVKKTQQTVKLAIGDWSQDGHNQCKDILYSVNKSVEEIQNAYRASCKLTGVQFHYDYSKEKLCVACEYEDRVVTAEVIDRLAPYFDIKSFCLAESGDVWFVYDPEVFANLIMKFISLSLDGFEYKLLNNDSIPYINGHHSDLNESFGYGLFY